MQILCCFLSSFFNRCLATWYALGFNILWLGCLFFMLNKDDSELLLLVYQAVVIENYFWSDLKLS